MYRYGRGVSENRAEARLWCVRAADHADPYARQVIAVPFTRIEKFGLAVVALIGVALCFGYPRSLPVDSSPNGRLVKIATGALMILISGFNGYGYAHYWFRNFPYGVTPLTFPHWLSAAAAVAMCLYLGKSGRRPQLVSETADVNP